MLAGAVAVVVTAVSLVGGSWLARRLDDDTGFDDDVVLDVPGEYQEPTGGSNGDASGTPLPDVALAGTDDVAVRTGDLLGTPMVINLWFSTCIPCRRELADFADVHRSLGDDVRFVGVNPFDSEPVMQRFADERGVAYELFRDPDAALMNELRVVNYPVTLFVAADGTVVDQTGELDQNELTAKIEELLL